MPYQGPGGAGNWRVIGFMFDLYTALSWPVIISEKFSRPIVIQNMA